MEEMSQNQKNNAGRFWTQSELMKAIVKPNIIIDQICFCGALFRKRWNIQDDQPDYWLATWREKEK